MNWSWINKGNFAIGISALAFVVSLLGFVISLLSYEKKIESLAITGFPTGTCSLWSHRIYNRVEIGMCWSVTVTNQSEDNVSLRGFQLTSPVDPTDFTIPPALQEIESPNGKPITFPVTLSSGSSLVAIVRVPFTITNPVECGDAYQYLVPRQHDLTQPPLADFAEFLSGVDLIGNPIEDRRVEDRLLPPYYRVPPKVDHFTGIFTTASSREWPVTLQYPLEDSDGGQIER